MATQRKTQDGENLRTLHVRVAADRLDRFREVVAAEDHRTVSQELRRYIDQRIAEADAQPALREAA